MKVTIQDAVFAQPRFTSHLHVLFFFAEEGRHLLDVETDPNLAPSYQGWLAQHAARQQEEYRLLLELSFKQLGSRGSGPPFTIEIIAEPKPDWQERGRSPRLDPDTAVRFLMLPLSILVENKLNDGALLLAIAHREHRAALRKALDQRWVAFQNGGGNTVLLALLKDARWCPDLPRRLFALTDCDGLAPGKRSGDCDMIVAECKALEGKERHKSPFAYKDEIALKVLDRRAIENYLPLDALALWVEKQPSRDRAAMRSALTAFRSLTPEQRSHYNLKEGLRKDEGSPERGTLFDELHQDPREHQRLQSALHKGFGDKLAAHVLKLCTEVDPETPFQAPWIDESCRAEMDPVIDRILALL